MPAPSQSQSLSHLEIELKAHLDDFAPVEGRLSVLGTYCRSYKKSDTYWFPAQNAKGMAFPPSGVRVRRESGIDANGAAHESVLITCKHKEISDGIEVNEEDEFTVSDAALFEKLLERLGLSRGICKEKQGKAWVIPAPIGAAAGQPDILAEVSLVTGLGWFLEIEILAEGDEAVVQESRNRLLALLEKLEISAERIEARPYTVMLSALREKE